MNNLRRETIFGKEYILPTEDQWQRLFCDGELEGRAIPITPKGLVEEYGAYDAFIAGLTDWQGEW